MSNRTVFIIIGTLLLLVILSMSMCFEVKEVADVNWNKQFKYELKDPNGAWLFKSMFEETYGEENVILIDSDTLGLDSLSTSDLYVYLGYSTNYRYEKEDSLFNWIAKGNDALIVCNVVNLGIPYDHNTISDTLDYYLNLDQESEQDTVLNLSFFNSLDSTYKELEYISRGRSIDETSPERFYHFTNENNEDFEPLISVHDSSSIFLKRDFGKGTLYFHCIPKLFVNVASHQDFYLEHYNYVISHFNPSKVYLDQRTEGQNTDPLEERQSPLQFILATPSLKWAYYTLLGGLLLFVLFGSKRKQKAIPTMEENKNTSLEYIQTVSQLYQSQNQNKKLVQHMKHIFLAKMKSKYYLDRKNPDYNHLLSRKSKMPESEIETLLKKLDTSEHYEFSDDQLISLYQQLEKFYKNCK